MISEPHAPQGVAGTLSFCSLVEIKLVVGYAQQPLGSNFGNCKVAAGGWELEEVMGMGPQRTSCVKHRRYRQHPQFRHLFKVPTSF